MPPEDPTHELRAEVQETIDPARLDLASSPEKLILEGMMAFKKEGSFRDEQIAGLIAHANALSVQLTTAANQKRAAERVKAHWQIATFVLAAIALTELAYILYTHLAPIAQHS